MVKVHTTVSIDDDVLKKAKDGNFNISGEFESALRKRMTSANTDIPKDDAEECYFCKRKFPRQTRQDVEHNTCERTLVWLCPEEVWCCESCLRSHQKKITRVAQ